MSNPVDFLPIAPDRRAKWLIQTATDISIKFIRKYELGQVEHDCDLGTVTVRRLLDEMENEALDQLAYVAEMRRRVNIAYKPDKQYDQSQSAATTAVSSSASSTHHDKGTGSGLPCPSQPC